MWSQFFTNWPSDLPRRGLFVTTLNEQVPFKGFMVAGDMLVVDRTNPDPSGTRFVILGFESIALVKLLDAVQDSVFTEMGFQGQMSGR